MLDELWQWGVTDAKVEIIEPIREYCMGTICLSFGRFKDIFGGRANWIWYEK